MPGDCESLGQFILMLHATRTPKLKAEFLGIHIPMCLECIKASNPLRKPTHAIDKEIKHFPYIFKNNKNKQKQTKPVFFQLYLGSERNNFQARGA